MIQLSLFEQAQKNAYKKRYDKFYAGVKERLERERKAKQKNDSETISIIHGAISIDKVLRKNRLLTPKN
jgi:hypothetical protein